MNNQEADAIVKVDRQGAHTAIVTINRPDARNAINIVAAEALEAAVRNVEEDDTVRAVVLTGSGDRAFCSGADLGEVATGRLSALFTPAAGFAGFVNAARRKPWIAAVNGVALAGGCEIALACDMILAVPAAQFGLPEVTRGLIASAGGLYRLPRSLPRTIALEMIVTGQAINAARALALGLINRVVEPSHLLTEAAALGETIAANAPLAVIESLRLARAAALTDDSELHLAGDEAQERLMRTADFIEGAKAFLEKRNPLWTGR